MNLWLPALILLAAGAAMSGAFWYARIAERHARVALAALRDTKKAIAEWWDRKEEGR